MNQNQRPRDPNRGRIVSDEERHVIEYRTTLVIKANSEQEARQIAARVEATGAADNKCRFVRKGGEIRIATNPFK